MMRLMLYGKDSYEQYPVYDIQRDKNGYPHFLIYDKGQWVYRSAKYFQPYSPVYYFEP